jgi:hypothetical protein
MFACIVARASVLHAVRAASAEAASGERSCSCAVAGVVWVRVYCCTTDGCSVWLGVRAVDSSFFALDHVGFLWVSGLSVCVLTWREKDSAMPVAGLHRELGAVMLP